VEKAFVIGAGGHAKVVIDIVEKGNLWEIAFLVDDDPALKGKEIFGYQVLGNKSDLLERNNLTDVRNALVAIGNNVLRAEAARWLVDHGFRLITAVHPSAQIARGVRVGLNTVVMAGAVINSDSVLGDSVIINTSASVDHDCVVAAGTHIAPGCHLCGSVTVGPRTMVGAGSTVAQGVTIGENCVIGAGSVVVQNIPPNVVALGNPAKPIRDNPRRTSGSSGE
jgi:sugar O-acyltransferase (sialic acid O-acetyltransferase NeuD family)